MSYKIYKGEESIHVFGDNQEFTKEDLESLWEHHNILYMENGVMAVWVEKRNNNNPLIHLMAEDDGHISWSKEDDRLFDSAWLDNYIDTLKLAKEKTSQ